MENHWLSYERKRTALENKWRARIRKALDKPLSSLIDIIKGDSVQAAMNHMMTSVGLFNIYPLLIDMYKDAGLAFAKETVRDIRRNAKALTTKRLGADVVQDLLSSLTVEGFKLAGKIDENTKRRIIALLQQSMNEGWGTQVTARRISEEIPEINRNRAKVIARTEIGRSANEGKMIAAAGMGLALTKQWITAHDERVRHTHRANHRILHDSKIDFEEPFANGLSYPGEKDQPPEQTINCRCTVVFEAKRDKNGRTIPKDYNSVPQGKPPNIIGNIIGYGIGLLAEEMIRRLIDEKIPEKDV